MAVIYFLCLAIFLVTAYAVVRRCFGPQDFSRLLTLVLPVFFVLLLVLVGLTGRILHRVEFGLLSGASLCLIALVLLAWKDRETLRLPEFRWDVRAVDIPLIVLLAVSTALVFLVLWKFSIYDENGVQGHVSVTEQMIRSHYPPHYLPFPDIPHKYHYGFNLLSAIFSIAFKIPGYRGIDVAAGLCWIMLLGVLLGLFQRLRVPRSLWAVALLFVLLSGGLYWPGIPLYGMADWQIGTLYGRSLNPTLIAYYFQHPMGLGIPLFLSCLLIFPSWFETGNRRALLLGAFSLGALSLSQGALFLTMLAALGLVFFCNFFRPSVNKRINLVAGVTVFLIAVGLGLSLGGFLQFGQGNEDRLLSLSKPLGYLSHVTWRQAGWWYFRNFGVVLLLFPLGIYWALRRWDVAGWILAFCCLMGFFIPQFFHYHYSGDIAKWFTVFELAGRLLILAAVASWAARRVWSMVLVSAVVLFGVSIPAVYLYELGWKGPQQLTGWKRRYIMESQVLFPEYFRPLFETLHACRECRKTVWSTARTSQLVAMHTGYPVLYSDPKLNGMPIQRTHLDRRMQLLKALEKNPSIALLREAQVGWVIFHCNEVLRAPEVQKVLEQIAALPGVEDYSLNNSKGICYRAYYLK